MSTVCPCFDVQLVEWQKSMVCLGNNDCKPLSALYIKVYKFLLDVYHVEFKELRTLVLVLSFAHIQGDPFSNFTR